MLKNKASHCNGTQAEKNNYSPKNPIGFNRRSLVELVEVSEFFPMTSDDVCRDTGIAAGQISRPNQTLADEATFGQVLGFGFVSHETRVPGWGWSAEGLNGSVLGFKSKRVFGIDSSNRGPVQFVGLENVVNNNPFVANFHTGVPKQQPSKIGEPYVYPRLCCKQEPRIYGQSGYSKKSKDESSTSHYATRSGIQGLSIHFPSLTQLASHGGECC
jgi:hypothetical protein